MIGVRWSKMVPDGAARVADDKEPDEREAEQLLMTEFEAMRWLTQIHVTHTHSRWLDHWQWEWR